MITPLFFFFFFFFFFLSLSLSLSLMGVYKIGFVYLTYEYQMFLQQIFSNFIEIYIFVIFLVSLWSLLWALFVLNSKIKCIGFQLSYDDCIKTCPNNSSTSESLLHR